MPRFKVERGFGIIGLRIENYKDESNVFLSHEEICIRPKISSAIDLENIPKYERLDIDHYQALQFYYFYERSEIYTDKNGRVFQDVNPELCHRLEREFKLGYYQKFKHDLTKIRIT